MTQRSNVAAHEAAGTCDPIYIAGCARSGTDLIRDLMSCFAHTDVWPSEHSPDELPATVEAGCCIVIKRKATDHQTLFELKPSIRLLYCVRHPFDCLTSSHPRTRHIRPFHVTPERWSEEFQGLNRLRAAQPERSIFFLRYEDLVARPDAIQEAISAHFRLERRHPFSQKPGGRPIVTSSVDRWKRQPELLAYGLAVARGMQANILEFCREFGYSLPDHFAPPLSPNPDGRSG